MSVFHKTQSIHNRNVLRHLDTQDNKFVDWKITILFYSALHIVDDYLVANFLPKPHFHHARDKLVRENLDHIYNSYRKLYRLSLEARYTHGYEMIAENLIDAKRFHEDIVAHT